MTDRKWTERHSLAKEILPAVVMCPFSPEGDLLDRDGKHVHGWANVRKRTVEIAYEYADEMMEMRYPQPASELEEGQVHASVFRRDLYQYLSKGGTYEVLSYGKPIAKITVEVL
jgi:hypothetical protein